MDWRSLMLLALFAWAWEVRAAAPDPVTSVMWDYYHQRATIPAAEAFRPLKDGGCPLAASG